MNRATFIERMDRLKAMELSPANLNSVCHLLSWYISEDARRIFRDIYSPFDGYYDDRTFAYFFKYDSNQVVRLSPEQAFENRLNAILLFEQQVLNYELYLNFGLYINPAVAGNV